MSRKEGSIFTQTKEDTHLYEQLVNRHRSELHRYALRLVGKAETAEDLLQETFYEAWRSIASLRDPKRGRGWLFQILRHRYAHWVRDRGRRIRPKACFDEVAELVSMPWPDVAGRLARQEIVQKALAGLDGRYREPFLRVFRDGLTCKAAAEKMHIPLGTVLSRIHRARQYLRSSIEAMDQPSALPSRSSHLARQVTSRLDSGFGS